MPVTKNTLRLLKSTLKYSLKTDLDEKYIKLPMMNTWRLQGIVDWTVALKYVDALTPIPSGSGPTWRRSLQMNQADLIRPLSL